MESIELPEDDPVTAIKDLQKIELNLETSKKYSQIIFIGITCGLSAPYAMSQIKYSMDNDYITILIGFNPTDCARDAPVENWTETCKTVVTKLENRALNGNRCFILNPSIGPEPG